MTAILPHERCRENAQLGKNEAQDRQLEDQAHGERKCREGRDIGADGDGADHSRIDLIGGKETEGNGKENEIVHHHSCHEQDIGSDAYAC